LIANYESILEIAKKKIFLSKVDSPSQEQQ
jgi:hypothetical protein